ncbi:hypothetical protein E5288_WYG010442 [Bos mutus]|uniref:Uncharacterized protein n=1 Tax=Bos mutus TaxID=72004 RepID=A0A6B0S791_9CETA|nr:hypothetical protein [Bos mutus]
MSRGSSRKRNRAGSRAHGAECRRERQGGSGETKHDQLLHISVQIAGKGAPSGVTERRLNEAETQTW